MRLPAPAATFPQLFNRSTIKAHLRLYDMRSILDSYSRLKSFAAFSCLHFTASAKIDLSQ